MVNATGKLNIPSFSTRQGLQDGANANYLSLILKTQSSFKDPFKDILKVGITLKPLVYLTEFDSSTLQYTTYRVLRIFVGK